MSQSATIVDLLRHGEPVGGRRFRGSRDDPLSYRGWKQMRSAVQPFAPWQAIITSPLRRCAEFAAEVSGGIGVDTVEWPDFREMSFGEWEGRTAEFLLENQREAIEAFWRDPMTATPPGGEALADFVSRVGSAWERLAAEHAGEHVLLVAHGGVNRVILAQALGMPLPNLFRIEVPYACMSRLHIHGDSEDRRCSLVFHGAR